MPMMLSPEATKAATEMLEKASGEEQQAPPKEEQQAQADAGGGDEQQATDASSQKEDLPPEYTAVMKELFPEEEGGEKDDAQDPWLATIDQKLEALERENEELRAQLRGMLSGEGVPLTNDGQGFDPSVGAELTPQARPQALDPEIKAKIEAVRSNYGDEFAAALETIAVKSQEKAFAAQQASQQAMMAMQAQAQAEEDAEVKRMVEEAIKRHPGAEFYDVVGRALVDRGRQPFDVYARESAKAVRAMKRSTVESAFALAIRQAKEAAAGRQRAVATRAASTEKAVYSPGGQKERSALLSETGRAKLAQAALKLIKSRGEG